MKITNKMEELADKIAEDILKDMTDKARLAELMREVCEEYKKGKQGDLFSESKNPVQGSQ